MGAILETLRRHTATTSDGVPMETVFIKAETDADIPEPQEKWALGSICWCIGSATWYGLSGGKWINQSDGKEYGASAESPASVNTVSPAVVQSGSLLTSDALSPDVEESVSAAQEYEPEQEPEETEESAPADDVQDEPSLVDFLSEEDVTNAESDGYSESE